MVTQKQKSTIDTKHKKGDWENDKYTKVGRNRGKRKNRDEIQAEGK